MVLFAKTSLIVDSGVEIRPYAIWDMVENDLRTELPFNEVTPEDAFDGRKLLLKNFVF